MLIDKFKVCTHQESNLDQRFRKPLFYPFNYGCSAALISQPLVLYQIMPPQDQSGIFWLANQQSCR